jgi:hypothetical protein
LPLSIRFARHGVSLTKTEHRATLDSANTSAIVVRDLAEGDQAQHLPLSTKTVWPMLDG